MKKENTENKDQSKDNLTKSKKALIQKRKKVKKIFLMALLMFNQHLTIQ